MAHMLLWACMEIPKPHLGQVLNLLYHSRRGAEQHQQDKEHLMLQAGTWLADADVKSSLG